MDGGRPGAERAAEVAEAAAEGSVAEVYADIRRVLGVPLVTLVYRILASRPGRLEAIWAELGPNLASDVVRGGAPALGAPADRAVAALRVAPVDGVELDREAAAATLRSFGHVNAVTLVGLSALLEGVDGEAAPAPAPPAPETHPDGLPMADLAALPESTLRLLERMSEPIAGAGRPLVIPSLFRHFAHDERALAAIWDALEPFARDPVFDEATAAIRDGARALAAELPYAVTRVTDPETRTILERFVRTIPAMIVTGRLIEALLAPGPTGQ